MITPVKTGKSQEVRADIELQVRHTVEQIIADVAREGEPAVRRYSAQFDQWNPPSFQLTASTAVWASGTGAFARRFREMKPKFTR